LICPECAHEWSPNAANEAHAITAIKDSNGNLLADGDTVSVIKDLNVKGSSSVVKVGTRVKNIRLVDGDHDIDCKIDGIGAMKLKSIFVKQSLMCLAKLVLFSIFTSGIWFPAFASTPVWKVEKDGSHIFIGGTVHLLTPADFPLPEAFDVADQQSDKIIFEANSDDMATPEFMLSMMQSLSYPKGQNLKLALSAETYQTLSRYCEERNIPIETLLPFKAGMVSMMLSMTELQKLGFTSEGVDTFYNQKAKQDKKPIAVLETVEQQLTFISNMARGQEDDLIIYTLKEMETLPQQMD